MICEANILKKSLCSNSKFGELLQNRNWQSGYDIRITDETRHWCIHANIAVSALSSRQCHLSCLTTLGCLSRRLPATEQLYNHCLCRLHSCHKTICGYQLTRTVSFSWVQYCTW